jgi:hypothetical protein
VGGAAHDRQGRHRRALGGLRPRGGTALYDGLFAASALPSSPARTLVAVFSDGEDNISWLDEPRVKDALARSNALVHVVGFVDPLRSDRVFVLAFSARNCHEGNQVTA